MNDIINIMRSYPIMTTVIFLAAFLAPMIFYRSTLNRIRENYVRNPDILRRQRLLFQFAAFSGFGVFQMWRYGNIKTGGFFVVVGLLTLVYFIITNKKDQATTYGDGSMLNENTEPTESKR